MRLSNMLRKLYKAALKLEIKINIRKEKAAIMLNEKELKSIDAFQNQIDRLMIKIRQIENDTESKLNKNIRDLNEEYNELKNMESVL